MRGLASVWLFDEVFVDRPGSIICSNDGFASIINELPEAFEYPKIPLHTNASENDLRACVIKRKISGGTMSADGRLARDVMLGGDVTLTDTERAEANSIT